jgi:hypothetical protein
MTVKKSQNERIKIKLARSGFVSRNECLSQFPAITRLGARIDDLEKQGYVFTTENTGRDYIYRLVSINGVPFARSTLPRQDHLKTAREAVAFFENY